jgi:hypothetical protein
MISQPLFDLVQTSKTLASPTPQTLKLSRMEVFAPTLNPVPPSKPQRQGDKKIIRYNSQKQVTDNH